MADYERKAEIAFDAGRFREAADRYRTAWELSSEFEPDRARILQKRMKLALQQANKL